MTKNWPLIFLLGSLPGLLGQGQNGPQLLTYDEIIQLYQQTDPAPPLAEKLHRLLTTPFVRNTAWDAGRKPLKPSVPAVGKILRVAQWNIERGLQFDAIRFAFTDSKQFNALMEDKASKADDDARGDIGEQLHALQQADLLILNEVDWGMNRTRFRNVASELADALGMNYAYGVEFVEVDPITMGIDQQVVLREVQEAYAEPQQDRAEMIACVKQRSEKGFVATNELGKTFGPVGQYKLDWMFIRPPSLKKSKGIDDSGIFAPHYGRTLKALNHSIPERISDHNPITVDLPLLPQRTN